MYVHLIETKAVHSSAFPPLFYLTLVLSAILIRSTTWIYGGDRIYADSKHVFGSPASSFPGLRKAGRGPGNEATHSSGRTGESCYRTFLRRLDEVCQLLHGVGQLLYEVNLLTASGGVACGYKFSWKLALERILIFYPYNQL